VDEVVTPRAHGAAELLLARGGERPRRIGEEVLEDARDLVGVCDGDARGEKRRRLDQTRFREV
jgi:hypothetical protein